MASLFLPWTTIFQDCWVICYTTIPLLPSVVTSSSTLKVWLLDEELMPINCHNCLLQFINLSLMSSQDFLLRVHFLNIVELHEFVEPLVVSLFLQFPHYQSHSLHLPQTHMIHHHDQMHVAVFNPFIKCIFGWHWWTASISRTPKHHMKGRPIRRRARSYIHTRWFLGLMVIIYPMMYQLMTHFFSIIIIICGNSIFGWEVDSTFTDNIQWRIGRLCMMAHLLL